MLTCKALPYQEAIQLWKNYFECSFNCIDCLQICFEYMQCTVCILYAYCTLCEIFGRFFDMAVITFAKLHKYLQIICKSWPISIDFWGAISTTLYRWGKCMKNIIDIIAYLVAWTNPCLPDFILEARLWVGWVEFAGLGLDELLVAARLSSSTNQSMQCSRPACTRWKTLIPISEEKNMALAQVFVLLSIHQLPRPVQSAVLQGGEQILLPDLPCPSVSEVAWAGGPLTSSLL